MTSYYGTPCRSSEPAEGYWGPSSTEDNVSTAAFSPSLAEETLGTYDALFDVELNVSDALATATMCRKNNWIDPATRSLTLQSVTLNAEVGMFAMIDIVFNFPAGGGVDKHVNVHTIHATGSKIEFADTVPELMWAGLIIILLRQEITQLFFAGVHHKCLDYWLDMWCLVDWVSIFV